MQPLWDERYQPADAEIVKNKARKMMKRRTLREHQLEDIEQEMALRIVQQSHMHDPKRGSREGFIAKTAENTLLSLIEKRNAKKRDDRRDIEYADGPEGTLIDGSLSEAQIDLLVDLAVVLEHMPPDLKQVYDLSIAKHTQLEIESLLNLTRGKVRVLVQRMEAYLAEHMRGYFFDPKSED